MTIKRIVIGGLVLALAGAAAPARAGIDCGIFFVQADFEAFCEADGKLIKGIEDFEPPVGNVPFGELAGPLVDPLQGNVPNVDVNGLGFPNGLVNKNLFIQSNVLGPNAPDPAPGTGLVALGMGYINGDNVPNSIVVGADTFGDSTDLIFPPGEVHTGIGFDVIDPISLNVVHISVFDQSNLEVADVIMDVSDLKTFFGIWCAQGIGRINIAGVDAAGGGSGELVDNIQMWMEPPQVPTCPWDCGEPRNKMVDVVDFLALLAQWGQVGVPCDFDGGGVSVTDFLKMLAAWGPCPMPLNDECHGAEFIDKSDPEGVTEVHFDMYGATPSPEPIQCLEPPNLYKDIWYCLTNATNQVVGVTVTTNIPLFVEVYLGCSCPPGQAIACGDGLNGTNQFVMGPNDQALIRLIDWQNLPNEELKGSMFITNKIAFPEPVNFFTNPLDFQLAAQGMGMIMKGTWSFKPDYLPDGASAAISDPLDISTHPNHAPGVWWDGEVDLWPPEIDNVQFSSNTTPGGPLTPRGVNGMWYGKPGAVPELTNNALVANTFVDSFDIVSGPPAGDNHTGMGLDLIGLDTNGVPEEVTFHVRVYDKGDVEIGSYVITALQGEKPFLGILTKHPDITIGRVDILDTTGWAEGISSLALYFPLENVCPAPGDCCASHNNPGCDDADCCILVCQIDPFCCETTWDSLCADEAAGFPECGCANECLAPGTCADGFEQCGSGTPMDCYCFQIDNDPNVGICIQDFFCSDVEPCPVDGCPPGFVCVTNSCCGDAFCVPIIKCGEPALNAPQTVGSGLTGSGRLIEVPD